MLDGELLGDELLEYSKTLEDKELSPAIELLIDEFKGLSLLIKKMLLGISLQIKQKFRKNYCVTDSLFFCPARRHFSNIFSSAKDSGLNLTT
jgi:hypothetical protein